MTHDEIANEGSAGRQLASGAVGKEAHVAHDLLTLFFGPLLQSYILLAELEQAFAVSDALVAVEDLPDVELLVAGGIAGLHLSIRKLFSDACVGGKELGLSENFLGGCCGNLFGAVDLPPKLCVKEAIAVVRPLHVDIDK